MDGMIDLIAYWFGEVTDEERDRIEAELMANPALLAEYFGLKRHFERGNEQGPAPDVRERLEADLFDSPRRARQPRPWTRWAAVGLAAAAALAAVWWWLQPGAPQGGTLVDTARPQAESRHTL